jgi:hypothetical protein
MEWKDTTSYSRGDKERVPTTFTIGGSRLSITVTCSHIYYKPGWVAHCHVAGIDTRPLKATSLDEAQREAYELVSSNLCKMMDALDMIKDTV